MTFNPQPIINKARKKALSVGEAEALSVYISSLEHRLAKKAEHTVARTRSETVELMLDQSGLNLVVIFPGESEHFVPLPGDRPDLSMNFLIRALRERRGQPNLIASPGAPTKADLAALAKASNKRPSPLFTPPENVHLEELDI